MFNAFDQSNSLGAHFGSQHAAIHRLNSTDHGKINISAEEDDGAWWAVEEAFSNTEPYRHGPFTDEQAAETFCDCFDKNRKPIPFSLSIDSPLELPDIGIWSFWSVVRQIRQSHPELQTHIGSIDLLQESWNRSDEMGWSTLKSILTKAGFDSVAYINAVEDKGSLSWIVWDNTKIHTQTHADQEQPSYEAPTQ